MGRMLLRTPELAEQFVAAALVLLEEGGPSAVTTRAVADAAESSLAALNDLFGSKAGLLDAVALHGFSALLELLDSATTDDNPHAYLFELCGVHRDFALERPKLTTHMYSRVFVAFTPSESDLQTAAVIRRHFTDAVASLLKRDCSADVVFDTAVGLIALLEGLASQNRAGTLGSTVESSYRRWRSAVGMYLDGAQQRFGNKA